MLKKTFLFALIIIISIVACTEESEDSGIPPNQLDKIEISSFKILENSVNGITTETKVLVESSSGATVNDHGVFVLKNNEFYDKIELGELSETTFITTVSSGLERGQNYSIYPYLYAKNTFFYGDTLDFESKLEIDFEVLGISPPNGFIRDTIAINGKNFCKSSETNINMLKLGEAEQRLVFESDDTLKFVVEPNISESELQLMLTTCGVNQPLGQTFTINLPVLDSISPNEAYVGQNTVLYGKNLHSNISKLWIDDSEVSLKDAYEIDRLTFVVPDSLPSGLLDIKLQVLDKTIEKPAYYQSTSPVIDELDKTSTGFLDTLTVRGKYFNQPNQELEIFVGGQSQSILSSTDEEIVLVIDRYFEVENPELILKTGNFELTENITMLPPEIVSIEKETYHILDEEIKVKTRYFIPTRENLEVGGGPLNRSWSVPKVDPDGTITIYSTKWLKSSYNWEAQFSFDKTGEVNIDLTTAYGNANRNYKVFPPKIDPLDKTDYFYGEQITLEGLDFGYYGVSKIYIDNVELETEDRIGNESAHLIVPITFSTGSHKLKIITGGQASNEVDFEILEATATSLDKSSGTRKDSFTIYGTNLQQAVNYGITANGEGCKVVSRSQNQVEFLLPYNVLLEPNVDIKFSYGGQTTDVRTINGIEPFENYENLDLPSEAFYWLHSGYNADFEYNGTLYNLNLNGIFEYNIGSNSWSSYETTIPSFDNVLFSTYKPSVNGDSVYMPSGNGFNVYDMSTRNWNYIALNLNENERFLNGVVLNENAYIVTKGHSNADPYEFYVYNLSDHTRVQRNLPVQNNFKSKMYQLNGKIIYDVFNENIFMYSTQTGQWEDLGHPMGSYKFNYDVNIYEYNNTLYYSGGQGNSLIRHQLYAYDFQLKTWSEKTPMPVKLLHHVMVGQGDYLYFGLGQSDYYLLNQNMYRYKISEDPN